VRTLPYTPGSVRDESTKRTLFYPNVRSGCWSRLVG
jgi:hypothetical protein